MTEFSVFMLLRWRFRKGVQNYMENKNEGNEKKVILGDFNPNLPGGDQIDPPPPVVF